MCLCVKCPRWTSILNGIASKLLQAGQWFQGVNLQVDGSCKMWGCVAHVCNWSWLSAVECIVPFCSSFPKPCKIQRLGSDAKETVVISVGCLAWNWHKRRKVHRRWDGLDELNDRFKFADFTSDFAMSTETCWRCLAAFQRCLRRLRILICCALNVFSSGDATTADFPETMTVLPLGLTTALSLVWSETPTM